MAGHKTVSLVLGGGGARGHAHIGVIRALEERDFEIRSIAGTSMGAVIGGVYAAGQLDTYEKWAYKLKGNDVVRLLDFSFSRTSVFKGARIFDVLKELIGEYQIEDLDIGFTSVATSINEQREIWLNSGPLFQAVRASTAVPGVFSPIELNGRTLVDGGLVNPIPIAPTLNDTNDMTIAVNLSALPGGKDTRDAPPQEDAEQRVESGKNTVQKFIGDLLKKSDEETGQPDAIDLLTKSIDVMQGAIARLKLAAYAPDVIIDISRDACSFFDFHRAEQMASLGYTATKKALERADVGGL